MLFQLDSDSIQTKYLDSQLRMEAEMIRLNRVKEVPSYIALKYVHV